MNNLIIMFRDYDGQHVARAVYDGADMEHMTVRRAIRRSFTSSMFPSQRVQVYTALAYWSDYNERVSIYNRVPTMTGTKWVWEGYYTPAKGELFT